MNNFVIPKIDNTKHQYLKAIKLSKKKFIQTNKVVNKVKKENKKSSTFRVDSRNVVERLILRSMSKESHIRPLRKI